MVLISDDGTPAARRRSGSGRPCFESKRRAHQKSGLRGEARADMAHELERRGGVRVRGAIHTILQDQVLLGERLGLFTIPRAAVNSITSIRPLLSVLRTGTSARTTRPSLRI